MTARHGGATLAFGVAALCLAACSSNIEVGPEAIKGKRPSGWVEMRQVQAAYIGSGNAGSGTLTFRGRRYPFEVGGWLSAASGCPPSRRRARCTTSRT